MMRTRSTALVMPIPWQRAISEQLAVAKELIEIMTGELNATIDLKFYLHESVRAQLAKSKASVSSKEDSLGTTAARELRAAS